MKRKHPEVFLPCASRDCDGCIMAFEGRYLCNVCFATFSAAEVADMHEVTEVACSACGRVNRLPFSEVRAFTCRFCGVGGAPAQSAIW